MDTAYSLQLMPGLGRVQRHGATTVVVAEANGGDAFADAVLDQCRTAAGEALLRELGRRVLAAEITELVPFGVVVVGGAGELRLFLHGLMTAVADGQVTSSAGAATWIEHHLPPGTTSVTVCPVGTTPQHDPRSDLTDGIVGAAGFRLQVAESGNGHEPLALDVTPRRDPLPVEQVDNERAELLLVAGAPAGPGDVSGHDVQPLAEHEHSEVDQAGTSADDAESSHGELPPPDVAIVEGIRCPRDHHNDPDALHCAQCGLKLGVHRTARPVLGPRPQLGVLVVDDGTTVPVRHDLVLGRDPFDHAHVLEGGARAAVLDDPSGTVSRSHALVVLDGWNVHIEDLDSSNGTFILFDPDSGWREVGRTERVRLTAGATLRLGERELVFESHDIREEIAS
jgi:hypothetical protein